MRLILLSLLASLVSLSSSPASFAQDRADAPPPKKTEEPEAAKKENVAAPEKATEASKPKVNWVDAESTGTLSGAKSGALDKTLWQKQNRSDIEFLLSRLPDAPTLRSILTLQRRLLLSRVDAGLIQNDIGPLRGNDLLIQRITKLMEMGLYDDAWDLYTQKAETPYDVSIVQLGMLLMLMKNDAATACLEEKVASSKYPADRFFATLDKACAQTLGSSAVPSFPDDPTLHAVYNDAGYSVSAATPEALSRLTLIQRALVLANGKIRYDGLGADVIRKTPSALLTYYLMDRNLPDSARAMIKAEVDSRGLTYYTATIARDPDWAKARAIKDTGSQWPYVESALKSKNAPADIAVYYGDMLAAAEPAELSPEILQKALTVLLTGGRGLPDFWLEAAQKQAPQKPIIYIYLQAFKSLTSSPKVALTPEDLLKALKALKPADFDQILAIIGTLDKEEPAASLSRSTYDKHSALTLQNNYVMPTVGLDVLLETAPKEKQIGITVLAVLNSLAADPDNMYSGTVRKALHSMLNVGLIEDAKLIGAETVASVLNKY